VTKIMLVNGETREIPEGGVPTDRGIRWEEGNDTHLIPWTAILEFIQERDAPPEYVKML
jgi:hypothetical protein